MKPGDIISLEIPLSEEYVAVVRHAVEQVARHLKYDQPQIDDIKLAVGEACTNAVRHCSHHKRSTKVETHISIFEDGIEVEIRNKVSKNENLPAVPEEPDTTREGGFGLYLIQKVMDRVDMVWEHSTAVVRMYKLKRKKAA